MAIFCSLPSMVRRMPCQSVKAPVCPASARLRFTASSICSGLLEASAGLARACSPSRNAFWLGFSSYHGRSKQPPREERTPKISDRRIIFLPRHTGEGREGESPEEDALIAFLTKISTDAFPLRPFGPPPQYDG